MFAGIETAARIERAECRLLMDGAAGIAALHPDLRPFTAMVAGGVAAHCAPHSPLNKLAGLGFDGLPDEEAMAAIEDAFATRGADLNVEVATLADPGLAPWLTGRGYRLVGFEAVLGCPLAPHDPPSPPDDVRIERSGREQLDTWIDLIADGFAAPEGQGVASHESFPREILETSIRGLAAAPGFVHYLATRGGQAAGGASMRITDGIAQLCGAATLPAHRRRGIQAAFLALRLGEASRAGCDLAVMTCQPGSKSQQNAQRRGFALLYNRAVLSRQVPG